jgi:two-component system OmpR family sensor kinase
MSFRARLFATYALVIVICLAIVGIATAAVLQGYKDRLAKDRLDNVARPISVEVRSLAATAVTPERLWVVLDEQAQKNNVYIMLVSSGGQIVRQATPGPSQSPVTVQPGTLPERIAAATQGRFSDSDRRIFLYAAYPLGKLSSAITSPGDAVFLATPRGGSLAILGGLMVPLLLGGMVALLASLLVAVLFARSISRPLDRVTGAAQQIAKGDYEQLVPEEGTNEMRRLAQSFNTMTGEVKKSQEQLRHFVADVSHELKSPLTSIQGFSQALIDGTAGDEETKARAANVINTEAKRMRRQVDELLELSRMRSGQFKMAHEKVDVVDVIGHCKDLFEIQAKERGIVLKAQTDGALLVAGDADRLEQVFSNLLDNAVKNTQSGGVVSISGRAADGSVEASVTDNGPGIPSDQLPHVFDRFYQVTGVRTGVGLGLAIAREIVLAHGGTIEAHSKPGEGAEFTVRLPAVA